MIGPGSDKNSIESIYIVTTLSVWRIKVCQILVSIKHSLFSSMPAGIWLFWADISLYIMPPRKTQKSKQQKEPEQDRTVSNMVSCSKYKPVWAVGRVWVVHLLAGGWGALAKYHLQNLHPSHITEPIATRTYTYTAAMLMSFRQGRAPYLESAFIILNLVQLIVSVLGLFSP